MSWVDVVAGVASVATALLVMAPVAKWILKRAVVEVVESRVSAVSESVDEIKLSLATQFGGNGGGMREAINGISREVAELRGRLMQHLRDAA